MQFRIRHTPSLKLPVRGIWFDSGSSKPSPGVKALALNQDVKVNALILSGKLKYTEKQLVGLIFNFEL